MAELPEDLRRYLEAESARYQPDPALPQRIARRTLQLQRRRRGRIVGGAAVLALGALLVPLVVKPVLTRSDQVSIAYAPTPPTARKAATTTTTTSLPSLWAFFAAPPPALPTSGFGAAGPQDRNGGRFGPGGSAAGNVAVLGATATRGGGALAPTGQQEPTRVTTTTRPGESPTTLPRTTTPPPPSTLPAVVPLGLSGPASVCAGVPTTYHATGTDSNLASWSNGSIGSSATYTFPAVPATANIIVQLSIGGSTSSVQKTVQVVATGTPPC